MNARAKIYDYIQGELESVQHQLRIYRDRVATLEVQEHDLEQMLADLGTPSTVAEAGLDQLPLGKRMLKAAHEAQEILQGMVEVEPQEALNLRKSPDVVKRKTPDVVPPSARWDEVNQQWVRSHLPVCSCGDVCMGWDSASPYRCRRQG